MKQILKSISLILIPQEKSTLLKLVVFDVLVALLDIAFLSLLLVIINFYTRGQSANSAIAVPGWLANKNSLLLPVIFLALFSVKNAFGFWVQKHQHHFFYKVASRLSERNIKNYLQGSYEQFVETDSSVQTRRISNQPIEFSHYILTNLQQLVSQTLLVTFTVVAILLYHPSLLLVLCLLLAPPMLILNKFTRKKLKALKQQTKAASAKTIQHLNESLAGYVDSNVYGRNDFFSRRYLGYQQQLNNTIASQQTLQALPGRLIEVFAVLGFFMLIAVNKYASGAPGIDILTIGVFMAAAYKVIPGIVKMMNSGGQMKTYEFILESLIPGDEDKANPIHAGAEAIHKIAFENVSFGYPLRPVLDGLNLEISKGDMMGISANSGKGKTTIINLLLGFLEPDAGSITVNGNITDGATRAAYRKQISLVKQQPFFIHDSVLKNITLSDAPPDEERLLHALQFCGLDKLLAQYPEGIHLVITENGKNISGGQRQRLMLARALYHDFDLLILDEPFSEMDNDAEQDILMRLCQLTKQGKMIILITHNKASLTFCNKVHLLDEAYA